MYMCIYVYVYVYMYMYTCIYVYVYVYVYWYVYVYVYMSFRSADFVVNGHVFNAPYNFLYLPYREFIIVWIVRLNCYLDIC